MGLRVEDGATGAGAGRAARCASCSTRAVGPKACNWPPLSISRLSRPANSEDLWVIRINVRLCSRSLAMASTFAGLA